jgi:hypothetical protein
MCMDYELYAINNKCSAFPSSAITIILRIDYELYVINRAIQNKNIYCVQQIIAIIMNQPLFCS